MYNLYYLVKRVDQIFEKSNTLFLHWLYQLYLLNTIASITHTHDVLCNEDEEIYWYFLFTSRF